MKNPTGLVFADLRWDSLCIGYCPNKHLHIFGFPNQLQGKIDKEALTLTIADICEECGCIVKRIEKLEWAGKPKWDSSLMSEGAGI